jgi:segregation and condensation protein B
MGDLFVIDGEENVTSLSPDDMRANLRIVEAMLFASSDPLPEAELARRLPEGVDIGELMKELQQAYAGRGVNLNRVGNAWAFRTASDLS